MSAASSTTDRENEALRRAQRAHEPSMEEILASIRNIIADDRENAKSSGRTAPARAPVAPPGPQIVYSKEPGALPRAEAPAAKRQEGQGAEAAPQARVIWSHPAQPTPAAEAAPAEAQPETPVGPPAPTAKAEAEAVAEAAKPAPKVESPRTDEPKPAPSAKSSPAPAPAGNEPLLSPEADAAVGFAFTDLSATLARRANEVADEKIQEMLRPLLKDWLDQNLPGIVEKLVRTEIERIARAPR